MSRLNKMSKKALNFKVIAECPLSKARASLMQLPHQLVDTPVFMPVGTQGTLKGLTSQQLADMGCQIMLGNTYHLGNRPVSSAVLVWLNFSEFIFTMSTHHESLLSFNFILKISRITASSDLGV